MARTDDEVTVWSVVTPEIIVKQMEGKRGASLRRGRHGDVAGRSRECLQRRCAVSRLTTGEEHVF
jgi:hypothetical protein